MLGETNLKILLKSMQPILQEEEYVFCSLSSQEIKFSSLNPIGQFQEDEGITVILDKQQADRLGLSYQYPCRLITLSVHSSLNAVGFLLLFQLSQEIV